MHPGPIALTGFMGSGKSTVGRILAHQLGWTFIDIDQQIETVHSRPASSLFHELGEAMFRAVEARITAECLALCCTVVALGGAAVDLPENQSLLSEDYHGCLIFLDGEFEVLINRCLQEENKQRATYRPLLHQPDKALARFLSRRTWNLANADLRIDVGSKSCEQSAEEIFVHLRAYKSSDAAVSDFHTPTLSCDPGTLADMYD